MTNIVEAKILTRPFKGRCPQPANSYDSSRYIISLLEIAIPNSIGICNHDQQSTRTIFRIVWLIFTHWLLLAWAIICCLFQSRQSRQSLYLHRNWNYQEYCVSTSIGKLNILETCIFFFFFPPFKQTEPQQHVAGYSKCVCIYIYIIYIIYIYTHIHTCIQTKIYTFVHIHKMAYEGV